MCPRPRSSACTRRLPTPPRRHSPNSAPDRTSGDCTRAATDTGRARAHQVATARRARLLFRVSGSEHAMYRRRSCSGSRRTDRAAPAARLDPLRVAAALCLQAAHASVSIRWLCPDSGPTLVPAARAVLVAGGRRATTAPLARHRQRCHNTGSKTTATFGGNHMQRAEPPRTRRAGGGATNSGCTRVKGTCSGEGGMDTRQI